MRPDAPWCTQCFFDLRAPEPAPEPVRHSAPVTAPPTAAYGAPAPDPLTAPLAVLTGEQTVPGQVGAEEPERTWPCSSCQTENGYDLDECSACGTGFLDGIHEGDVSLVIPGVGDIAQMTRNKAMGLAFAGIGVVMLLVLVIGFLLS